MRLVLYKSIDEILDELVIILADHYGTIPLYWGYSKNASLRNYAQQLVDDIFAIASSISAKDVVDVDINPSQITKIALRFTNTCNLLPGIDREKAGKTFLDLYNLSVEKRRKVFIDNVHQISSVKFNPITSEEDKRIVLYLNAIIRAYCEMVFCDEHTISGEISGPYDSKNGYVLVRSFHSLAPTEIHPYLSSFKYANINTYCVYNTRDKDELFTTVFGNTPSLTSDTNQCLSHYYIEVEDKKGRVSSVTSIKDLLEIIDYFKSWISVVSDKYNDGGYSLWRATILCEFFSLKPLLDRIGLVWNSNLDNLSLDLFESVKPTLEEQRHQKIADTANAEYFKKIRDKVDPRIH